MWVVDGMMKLNLKIKQTSELDEQDLNSLIDLKQQYWNYSTVEQKKWFEENIKADDYHVLIYQGKILIAYLNAVNVEVNIDQHKYRMIGIGNVCVDKENAHVGVGSILMAYVNAFIKQSSSCGILLCNEKLIPFYESSNWKIICPKKLTIIGQSFDHVVMLFDPFRMVDVDDNNQMINLSRNF